jgi:type I restriction enzyme M protein
MERLFSEVTAQYPNIYSTGERLRISDDTVMSGIVRRLENFSFTGTGDDIKGAVYEIFLKSQLRGELDQYFTPREIVEFMTSLADPNIGERVLDAACGSGGFLIHAFRHVKQKIDDSNAPDHTKQEQNDDLIAERLWGVEIDEDLHTLAKINLIMHGDGYNHIIRGDGLSTEYLPEDFFDVVLMNPPFTTQYANRSVLDRYILGQGRTAQELDILFVERAVRSLRPGGRLLIVLPEGMLNLPSYGEFREWLITNCDLTHTISLPEGTFQPFGNSASKTCILGVWKKSEDDAVPTTIFAAQARNIGFEPGKRDYRRTDRNDLVRFVDVHERIEPFVGNEDREFQAVIADRVGAPRERFDAGAQLNAYEVRNLTVFRRARFVPLNANVVSVRGTERLPNREVLYFQADWVAPGTGVIQSVEFRSRQGRYNRLSAGDVFLVSINPKLNRVVLIPGAVDEIWTTNEGHVLELNPGGPIVHPGYLCAALRADYVVRQMVRLATGSSSSRARLSDHDFCQIMVPVIDEADQIRIGSELVAAIDASWTASLRLRSALEATDRLVAFLK